MNKFKFLLIAIGTLLATTVNAELITVVVGFSPGSSTDAVVRNITTQIQTHSDFKFVIENKPGVGGMLSWRYVEKEPAMKFLALSGGMSVYGPVTDKDNNIQQRARFIGPIASSPMVLARSSKSKIKTLAQLFDRKAKPQRLNIGVIGPAHQFLVDFIKKNSPHDIETILYKGSTDAYKDLLGNSIDLQVDTYSFFKTLGNTDAVIGTATVKNYNGKPAINRYVPGAVMSNLFGLGVKSEVPQSDLLPLMAAINNTFAREDVKESFTNLGYELDLNPKADYMQRVAIPESQKWQKIISRN